MASEANTSNTQNSSTIIAASTRISQLIDNSANSNTDLNAEEEAEMAALTAAMFASTPQSKDEATALYKLALDHLECLADGGGDIDGWTIHRALAASQPLLCAA